jgi:hypothetical protein
MADTPAIFATVCIVTAPVGVNAFAPLRRGAVPFRPSAIRRITLLPPCDGIDNIVRLTWELMAQLCLNQQAQQQFTRVGTALLAPTS